MAPGEFQRFSTHARDHEHAGCVAARGADGGGSATCEKRHPLPLSVYGNELEEQKKRTGFPIRFNTSKSALLPVAANPHAMMAAPDPAGTNPYGAWMRSRAPTAMHPYPATTPFPLARNPNPNIQRSGCSRNHLVLGWRRTVIIRRGRRWRRRRTFINHAASQQRQAEGNK
jgi:hypothetical protein